MTAAGGLSPQAILFDLGGVLMDFGGLGRLADLTGYVQDAGLEERWVSSQWPLAYERGECTSEAFAAGIVAEWDLDLSPSEFIAEFRSWSAGPFDGAAELLHRLHGEVAMGCLSNTNPTHWQQHLDRWGLAGYFDWTFVSHELGATKPEPEIYQAVIARMEIAPEHTLFLDDRIENVIAARTHGFRAEQTRGVEQVRQAISAHFLTLLGS